MVTTFKQNVTMNVKKRILQGGDSYPSRLTGIKGDQLNSRQVQPLSEIAATVKQSSPHHWQSSKEHTSSRFAYDYITKLCRQQAEVLQNHDNENVRNIGQGEA
jgi:hypothetical protein